MPFSAKSALALFADDALFHCIIKKLSDAAALQFDLDGLVVREKN